MSGRYCPTGFRCPAAQLAIDEVLGRPFEYATHAMMRGRVLLLEDDVALRGLLLEALEGEGFEVRACQSFAELRRGASAREADIVVADFWGGSQRTLPDAERDQVRELGSYLPVVLLTGRTWAASVTAQELGARALMRKPFDLDELLKTLEAALGEPHS